LTALRKKYAALRRGEMLNLYAQCRTFAFARRLENEVVILLVNADREPVSIDLRVDGLLSDGTRLVEEWTRQEIVVQNGFADDIQIAAREGMVWVAQ
jgi:hypothetical protein